MLGLQAGSMWPKVPSVARPRSAPRTTLWGCRFYYRLGLEDTVLRSNIKKVWRRPRIRIIQINYWDRGLEKDGPTPTGGWRSSRVTSEVLPLVWRRRVRPR